MRKVKLTSLVLMVALMAVTPAYAAEAVDLTDKVVWKCEGDTKVSLDQKSGKLRIRSKSAKVDHTLPFYACHSSHCDWGKRPGAAECQEIPCAEIIAGEKDQSLTIRLPNFERSCSAKKTL